MNKQWLFLLTAIIIGIVLLTTLILLAITRRSVPVHIDAKLINLPMVLAESKSTDKKSWQLLQNLKIESIEFTDCQEIVLVGAFYDVTTSHPINEMKELRLVPDDKKASIAFTGALTLKTLVVEGHAYVNVTPSIHLHIEGNSHTTIQMKGIIKVEWVGCRAQKNFTEGSGQLDFRPNIVSRKIKVFSNQNLLNLYLELPERTACTFEEELPVAALEFLQSRFDASGPDVTTTIKEVKIMLPTLPNEKPITLPEGSYLKIGNLRNFTLKRVLIDPSKGHILTTLYGYTNDLRAAYGRGELTQLLPASLILLRQNASIVAIVVILLWFVKITTDIYDRWRVWKGEK